MKRLSVMALGAALSCTLALTACSAASPDTVPQDMQQTPAAPSEQSSAGVLSAFSATDLNGNAVDQSVLVEYDLTMVNVWATFCGPCIHAVSYTHLSCQGKVICAKRISNRKLRRTAISISLL